MKSFLRTHKWKIALVVTAAIIACIYGTFYFQKGMLSTEGEFLRLSASETRNTYANNYSKVTIDGRFKNDKIVKAVFEIGETTESYIATFGDKTENGYPVSLIDKNKNEIFNGFYDGSDIYILENGSLLSYSVRDELSVWDINPEHSLTVITDADLDFPFENKGPYSAKYVLHAMSGALDTTRGDGAITAPCLLLLICVAVDMRWPLLSFKLSHFLWVKDAEPSEFFRAMQVIGWCVCTIIFLIGMAASIR